MSPHSPVAVQQLQQQQQRRLEYYGEFGPGQDLVGSWMAAAQAAAGGGHKIKVEPGGVQQGGDGECFLTILQSFGCHDGSA